MLEGLRTSIDAVKVSKEAKEDGKHYIPFNKAEWAELETAYGSKLMPKDLKEILVSIFKGHATYVVKGQANEVEALQAALDDADMRAAK